MAAGSAAHSWWRQVRRAAHLLVVVGLQVEVLGGALALGDVGGAAHNVAHRAAAVVDVALVAHLHADSAAAQHRHASCGVATGCLGRQCMQAAGGEQELLEALQSGSLAKA